MKARWVRRYGTGSVSLFSFSLTESCIQNRTCPSQVLLRTRFHPINYADISSLLSTCGKEENFNLGSSFHAWILKNHRDFDLNHVFNLRNILVVWNSLLSMYWKCGKLNDAHKLFHEMDCKDTVSWNIMISGWLRNEDFEMGFGVFRQMHASVDITLDHATLTTVLSACNNPDLLHAVMMVHSLAFFNGFQREISVGNALVTAYFGCGHSFHAQKLFEEMYERNVVTWTAVISGLAQNKRYDLSLTVFSQMRGSTVDVNSLTYSSSLLACSGLSALDAGKQIHGLVLKSGVNKDLCVESALMDMYSKCGNIENACKIFETAEEVDTISMTVILAAFVQYGLEHEAVKLFMKMIAEGIDIDANVVSSVLGVFGSGGMSLAQGKQIHALIIKKGFDLNTFVCNGFINMYSKSGEFEDSVQVFNEMTNKNTVSWNSMIAAFARHGFGCQSFQLYKRMEEEGLEPTDVTFLSLLHACSHVGFIEMGMKILESMSKVHNISPRMQHYACVVDMLGRAGMLEKAKSFIKGLNLAIGENGSVLWQALLGACSIYGNSEMGKYAAEELLKLEPENPTVYLLLANMYSSDGRWKEKAEMIRRMKETGVRKKPGMSWIEVGKELHIFVVQDKLHPSAQRIYEVLGILFEHMRFEDEVAMGQYSEFIN